MTSPMRRPVFNALDAATVAETATGTTTGKRLQNNGYTGIRVDIEVTGLTSTPTLTVSIEYQDERSGNWYNLLTGAAISANGHQVLYVDPRAPETANTIKAVIAPTFFRVKGVRGGTFGALVWSARVTLAP